MQPAELAIALEERGFESLWFPEHTHIPASRLSAWPGGAELPRMYYDVYDPFVSLAAAASVTKQLKLATGVPLACQHSALSLAYSAPEPVQRPHPPIHVAGSAPHALKRVVRDGDGIEVSLYACPPKEDFLRRAADAGASRAVFALPPEPLGDVLPLLNKYAALAHLVG